jgi:transposase
MRGKGIRAVDIAKELGIGRSTVYKVLKEGVVST